MLVARLRYSVTQQHKYRIKRLVLSPGFFNPFEGYLMAKKDGATGASNTVVRILRTVPIGEVIYRADQLVSAPADLLRHVSEDAYDASDSAIALRKSEGAEVIEHGVEKVVTPAAGSQGDEGEIVD